MLNSILVPKCCKNIKLVIIFTHSYHHCWEGFIKKNDKFYSILNRYNHTWLIDHTFWKMKIENWAIPITFQHYLEKKWSSLYLSHVDYSKAQWMDRNLFLVYPKLLGNWAQCQSWYGTPEAEMNKGLAQESKSGSLVELGLEPTFWSVTYRLNQWATTAHRLLPQSANVL